MTVSSNSGSPDVPTTNQYNSSNQATGTTQGSGQVKKGGGGGGASAATSTTLTLEQEEIEREDAVSGVSTTAGGTKGGGKVASGGDSVSSAPDPNDSLNYSAGSNFPTKPPTSDR